MKFIVSGILFFCSLAIFSQNVDATFLANAELYRTYKKELYYDFMPKDIIPEPLKKSFYANLSPLAFAQGIGQQMDNEHQTQRLYLTTQKVGAGFITVNRGGLDEMDVATSIIYICNGDTLKNIQQASALYGLKANALKSVKYQLLHPSNALVIRVESDR